MGWCRDFVRPLVGWQQREGRCQWPGVKRRNRRLLLTTNTLLNAIAALATTGESDHDIASGIAATL